MLSRSLEVLKLKSLLHSHLMRDHLYDSIAHQAKLEYKKVLFAELQDTGQQQWRENEYARIADDLYEQIETDFTIPLQSAFVAFFCRDGMQIHARPERLEEYNALCRDLHPYSLIAAWMASELSCGNLSSVNAERLSEKLTETALPHAYHQPFAENHCHEGGASNNNAALLFLSEVTSLPRQRREGPAEYLRSKGELLSQDQEVALFRTLFVTLCSMIMDREGISDILSDFGKQVRDFMLPLPGMTFERVWEAETIHGTTNGTARDILLKAFKQKKKQYFDSAVLLFLTAFFLLLEEERGRQGQLLSRYVLLFLHQMNRFRSAMTMHAGKGLTEFVKYYGSIWRHGFPGKNCQFHPAMRNVLMGGTQAIEFRSGTLPTSQAAAPVFREMIKTLHKHHPAYSLNYTDPLWQKIPHPSQCHLRFNYGYHFIKQKLLAQQKFNAESEARVRYQRERAQVRKSYDEILTFMRQDALDVPLSCLFTGELHSATERLQLDGYRFDCRLLLRTLDAAGDENVAAPEIFAPFARKLRNCPDDLLHLRPNKKRRKFRLAFHAGEDFACIVSGMRRIDETVRFMDYESGDRLGHALAIGQDPEEWLEKQQETLLTTREYFDNCVWLAEMAKRCAEHCPEALTWYVFYSDKVKDLSHQLYSSDCCSFSVHDFYQAWLLRRNLPGYYADHDPYFSPDYCDASDLSLNKAKRIHEEYLSPSTPCWNAEERTITLRHADFFSYSAAVWKEEHIVTISTQEAKFWRMVQDYQLHEYSMRGLILESNPSSNVYIGEMDRYKNHPIFRWYPLRPGSAESEKMYNPFGLRRGPIQVCVNSDDPSIFSTTLPNEFALLRNSLTNQRLYTQLEIDDWLERLRQSGMRIFDENYISPFYHDSGS